MYALEQGHKNRKFFHIRKEICPFIDAHYEKLVPKTSTLLLACSSVDLIFISFSESVSWRQTVNMTLSHPQYAHIFMQESQDHEFGRRKGIFFLHTWGILLSPPFSIISRHLLTFIIFYRLL